MPLPTLKVTIVDSHGVARNFHANRLGLDCGCGCLDIQPGKPAFCRGFDQGTLTLDVGQEILSFAVTRGMASLKDGEVHVICDRAVTLTEAALTPNHFPGEQPEAKTHKE